VLGVSVDITEHRRDEEEKRRLTAQLHQAQKLEAIGTLAGGIAHDFNNILGAIIGYAEMLRDDSPAGSPAYNDSDQVLKAGMRAKELVRQILAFSRQSSFEKVALQPGPIVEEAVKLLRASLPATIVIVEDIENDCGPVLADPTHLHQIVMNLGTNAFHAMEGGGGVLEVRLGRVSQTEELRGDVGRLAAGDYVRLSIADSGDGIAPEVRQRIFDPYFTTKEVGKGTGLGLATVQGIVAEYGGAVVCDSVLGQGTTFHVYLPASGAVAQVEEERDVAEVAGGEHILLVDDEPILADLGRAMLQRAGYRVTSRTSSLEALSAFQNQPELYDLVITDQTMPGMTGIDLARRLLQLRPGLPIILSTGYGNALSEERVRAMGLAGFAMKPLVKKDIVTLIRQVLAKRGR
jgi:nitrogen-specific signal transduction histidine kinase/ActR/RegA family two-component response regulator